MKKDSTQEKGFIVWLDFTKVSKHDVDLLARPELLPKLPHDCQHSTKEMKKLIEAARTTSSVASKITYDCDHDYLDHSKNNDLSIAEVTHDFKKKILSAQEYSWYTARKTWEQVIEISTPTNNMFIY
jgi:hypothetical protein